MISAKRISFLAFTIILTIACAAPAVLSQAPPVPLPRPSQKASVMQTIGVTDVTIIYSRPPVKGRTIFADAPPSMAARAKGEATLDNQNLRQKGEPIVPWGHVWRTGANEATEFIVTDDVLINGQPLKAGTYSLHTVPDKDEWTVIFNNDPGQWGSFRYDSSKDALRVKTKAQTAADNQEWLMYSFDPVTDNSAQVNIRWEKMRVPFTVEVKDVKATTLAKLRRWSQRPNPTTGVLPCRPLVTRSKTRTLTKACVGWTNQSKSKRLSRTFRPRRGRSLARGARMKLLLSPIRQSPKARPIRSILRLSKNKWPT